jgi:hypothetical protein
MFQKGIEYTKICRIVNIKNEETHKAKLHSLSKAATVRNWDSRRISFDEVTGLHTHDDRLGNAVVRHG